MSIITFLTGAFQITASCVQPLPRPPVRTGGHRTARPAGDRPQPSHGTAGRRPPPSSCAHGAATSRRPYSQAWSPHGTAKARPRAPARTARGAATAWRSHSPARPSHGMAGRHSPRPPARTARPPPSAPRGGFRSSQQRRLHGHRLATVGCSVMAAEGEISSMQLHVDGSKGVVYHVFDKMLIRAAQVIKSQLQQHTHRMRYNCCFTVHWQPRCHDKKQGLLNANIDDIMTWATDTLASHKKNCSRLTVMFIICRGGGGGGPCEGRSSTTAPEWTARTVAAWWVTQRTLARQRSRGCSTTGLCKFAYMVPRTKIISFCPVSALRKMDRHSCHCVEYIKCHLSFCEKEDIKLWWCEYFDNLFNGESESTSIQLDDSFDDANRHFVRRIQETEVREAIKRMKGSKAVGPDAIPIEISEDL
ncbi:hypothetical protein U9M48_005221 [Paspalum notatum var. saurae]|uniref:Uncharacterized protein n=1 Tax=Paspalum notatum var. saurae TaxID=547442 RepID=A0AAQ3SFC2_PASNO